MAHSNLQVKAMSDTISIIPAEMIEAMLDVAGLSAAAQPPNLTHDMILPPVPGLDLIEDDADTGPLLG